MGGPMRKVALNVLVGLGIAALAAPASAANGFLLKLGDITGEGGRLDKKSGQQWVPATSWFWGEYIVADGAPKVSAELQDEGFFDRGSVRIAGSFQGCEVGKTYADGVLKTPGVRYTFQNVVITKCKPTSVTFNYENIRSSAAW
jgi:hypothetical protein